MARSPENSRLLSFSKVEAESLSEALVPIERADFDLFGD
jgi:hypothetical protein